MRSLSWAGRILLALAALLLLATLVSLIGTNRGVVRMLDFVREPTIYLAALLAVLALFLARPRRLLVIGMLVVTIAVNLWRIWPYTFLAGSSVPLPDDVDGMSCARVLSLNVLQSNDRYEETAALIERTDPDILLLMETNQAWLDALEPQLARYGYRLDRPLDNRYGMAFATRLRVDRAAMVDTVEADTPTLYATLRTDDGARFELIGLHPRPPLPGRSTAERDANIARAGAQTPDGLGNVLAIGDFNDVPWSSTTRRFVREGGYLDPRAGRGSFASFPADKLALGWPLDQIFIRDGVKVASLEIGESVGSDHRPLLARVCVDPMATDGDLPDKVSVVPRPAQTEAP
ncbi:endonuclease/exonuclease/phosphatase family protein [Erythrobacter sp. QSSC1-22B]|uniref:endonuclease/exonuclease/phosphatase family protein n=1 Tax=Erythrobacter sp. QSSC1-22B TaxID=1860125 RepID=UPI001438DE65|nr:endonuclease/exonuclease/phosphatase family protein [Erythrobacter sp. QSSC1-22B]